MSRTRRRRLLPGRPGRRTRGAAASRRGSVALYRAHLADLDPKWNVNGNKTTTCANIDAALAAAESDDTRLGRLRDVLSDEAAAAGYREEFGKAAAGRFTTPDLGNAVAAAEALRKRVSRVRELFATPGGDAALLTALEDRNPSWSHTGTPTDIERALDVAERRLDPRQAATLEHRVVLEAEQQFPNVPAAAWRRTGEGFHEFTDSGRPGRCLARTLADRARAVAIAASRAARAADAARPGEAAVRVGAAAINWPASPNVATCNTLS